MAFCSSRLEPNIHTDHWGATLTFPYHRAISAVSWTAAHSRGLRLRGTFPDKALWWALPKSVIFLWSFALFNMCMLWHTQKHTSTHTLNYLGNVPLSASLTLCQSGPEQLLSKHFKCSVAVTRKLMICKPTIWLWNISLKLVCFSFAVLFSSTPDLSSLLTCLHNHTGALYCVVFYCYCYILLVQ